MDAAFDLNLSFLLVPVILTLLYLVLRRIFFLPMGEVLERRNQKIRKIKDQREALLHQVGKIQQQIDHTLAGAREEMSARNQERLEKARQEMDRRFTRALSDGEAYYRGTVKEAAGKLNAARDRILEDLGSYSRLLLEKLP